MTRCNYCNEKYEDNQFLYGGSLRLCNDFGLRESSQQVITFSHLCKQCGFALSRMVTNLVYALTNTENILAETVQGTKELDINRIIQTYWQPYWKQYIETMRNPPQEEVKPTEPEVPVTEQVEVANNIETEAEARNETDTILDDAVNDILDEEE